LNAAPIGCHSDVQTDSAVFGDILRYDGNYWAPAQFSYKYLDDQPIIPSLTSQLQNNSGFVTQTELSTYNSQVESSLTAALSNNFVHSINGQTGAVSVTAATLGLGNVNNTSDLDKPLSIAATTANAFLSSQITALSTSTNDAINNLSQLTTDSLTALQQVANRKVDSVNAKTGQVVLNPDDLDDTNTAHKFVTSDQITLIGGALQYNAAATVATSGSYNDLLHKPTLGSAAATDSSSYATAAQGALAVSALQMKDINVYIQPFNIHTVVDANYVSTDNNFSDADKTKLTGIEAGAEVNVRSDWNATSGDAVILNKPSIPSDNSQLANGAGYIDDYTVTSADVVAHQADLAITESQISDFGTYAPTASLATVATTGAWNDVQGKPELVYDEWDDFTLCDTSRNELFDSASYSHTGYYYRHELFVYYSVRITLDGNRTFGSDFTSGFPDPQYLNVGGLPFAALNGKWPAQVTIDAYTSSTVVPEVKYTGVIIGGDESVIKLVNATTGARLALQDLTAELNHAPVSITVTAMYPSRTNVENNYP